MCPFPSCPSRFIVSRRTMPVACSSVHQLPGKTDTPSEQQIPISIQINLNCGLNNKTYSPSLSLFLSFSLLFFKHTLLPGSSCLIRESSLYSVSPVLEALAFSACQENGLCTLGSNKAIGNLTVEGAG